MVSFVDVVLQSRTGRGRPPPWCNPSLLRLPSTQEKIREAWCRIPAPPSDWSADRLAFLHAKSCRMVMAETCPASASAPRQPWIAEETWGHVKYGTAIKKQLARTLRAASGVKLRMVFCLFDLPLAQSATDGAACGVAPRVPC